MKVVCSILAPRRTGSGMGGGGGVAPNNSVGGHASSPHSHAEFASYLAMVDFESLVRAYLRCAAIATS